MQESVLIEKEVNNKEGTKQFTIEAVKYFHVGDTVLLYGKLGSGKTFLTREFVRLIGSDAPVSSPSFSLINQYEGDIIINHVDFYRINNTNDLINLGLDDLWSDDYINFIEWPEIVEKQINWQHFRIYIESCTHKMEWRKFRLSRIYE